MKYFLLVMLLSTMVLSCKKEKNLGPLYESFVGVWKPTNQDYSIDIKSNGELIFKKNIERQLTLSIDYIREDTPFLIDEKIWDRVYFVDEGYESFLILYNESMDTITRYNHDIIDDNGNLLDSTQIIYFVRK